MNIHRGFLWIAAGALGASAYLYFRKRLTPEESNQGNSPPHRGEPTSPSKESVEPTDDRSESPASTNGSGTNKIGPESEGEETANHAESALNDDNGMPGGERELSEFLGGESWFDEVGWQEIWKREGVVNPSDWLRDAGQRVLTLERRKLADHPALLAGCRRRWIVVSRYADIDVAIAAELWNQTDD